MTPDEAIRRFERRMPGVTMRGTRELYEYAIEAFREKQERERLTKSCGFCYTAGQKRHHAGVWN